MAMRIHSVTHRRPVAGATTDLVSYQRLRRSRTSMWPPVSGPPSRLPLSSEADLYDPALAADHPSGVLVRERDGPEVEEIGQLIPGFALVGRPGDAAAGNGEDCGELGLVHVAQSEDRHEGVRRRNLTSIHA